MCPHSQGDFLSIPREIKTTYRHFPMLGDNLSKGEIIMVLKVMPMMETITKCITITVVGRELGL